MPARKKGLSKQSKRFIEAAKVAGGDQNGKVFEKAFKMVTKKEKREVTPKPH